MKKNIFILLLLFISCGVKTYMLENGFTKVPVNATNYLEIEKFDLKLNKVIDTSCIYEQFNIEYKILSRLDKHVETNIYGVLRFYGNGRFNQFYLNRERNQLLIKNNFNPSYSGYRGYYNKKDSDIRFDIFAPITQTKEIGKLSGIINVQGDTIYLITSKYREAEIFIKRKVSNELLDFRANW
ncbi:hypothetical protein [Flavobacterium pectinovorum]|uniref:Lipoprotein n=1 Tax=Flavobacterium pectinovorum TaxID=29533 RepID=A0AB36NUJ9_9FLAO|nr:hypothetical protein [Flavobacterium pectinovorum]OXA98646.1 hypothetical protein B0A72_23320 [Flavobacterium pectinovorum]SHN09394.1 hypothetical protein SAMN05444387_4060 [Flavobacterium pectinovorum]